MVHVPRLRLQRLEDVEAALDHERNDGEDRAAGVVHCARPALLARRMYPREPLAEVALPHRGRHDRALLRAEVVSGEHDVQLAPGGLQDSREVLEVESPDSPEDRVGHLWPQDHVLEDLLHAPQVHRGLELRDPVEAVAHEHRDAAGRSHAVALRLDAAVVVPVRRRPVRVGVHFLGSGGEASGERSTSW